MSNVFDIEALKAVCQKPIEGFYELGEVRKGKNGNHTFVDNGADILFVAHLDCVSYSPHFNVVELDSGIWVLSRQLDDRLGAYIGTELLPQLGVKADFLLTENEERGHSTASDFETTKDYNWMFMFDRAGSSTVLYEYEDKDLKDRVTDAGGTVGQGSYSCIRELEHLECKGVNWATWYHDNHGEWSKMHVGSTVQMVNQFVRFYNANHNIYLPHQKKKSYQSHYPTGGSHVWRPTENEIGKPPPASPQDNHKLEGYLFCTHCRKDVETDFWNYNAARCLVCASGLRDVMIRCPACSIMCRESGFRNGVCITCERRRQWEAKNPNGKQSVTLQLKPPGGGQGGVLFE